MPKTHIFSNESESIFRSGLYSAKDLAAMFNCHSQTIYSTAKRLGVVLPRSDMRRYKPNDHYFKTWSNEMAYVLGLLAADGHVAVTKTGQHIVMINLKESDKELVERIKKFVDYSGPIYSQRKSNGETQAVLTMTSKEMVNDLRVLGLGQNKTHSLVWPNSIYDEFVPHFVRGYFDGDGCIFYENSANKDNLLTVNIIGTPSFIDYLKNQYHIMSGNAHGYIAKKGVVNSMVINGKFAARSFLDWIYKDSTEETRLSRKYNIYQKFLLDYGTDKKLPNNSKINFEIAKVIRDRHANGETVSFIASELNIGEALVHDVVGNRSWVDNNYLPVRKKSKTIVFDHDGRSGTLKQWAEWTGVAKSTIDRRLREGKSFADAISTNKFKTAKPEVNIGRSGMTRSKATEIRKAYSNGIKGKESMSCFNISKSQYIDIIGNRVWKEEDLWWK